MEPEELLQNLQLNMPPRQFETWKGQLETQIAYLIQHDFEKLVRLLYTVDVNERDLKYLLQQEPKPDASAVITELLIQRQLKKIQTRQQFKTGAKPPDEEAW